MNEKKKVMIAYDGSAYADAALDDLRRAGLPREAEALIVTVSDGLVSASSPIAEVAGTALHRVGCFQPSPWQRSRPRGCSQRQEHLRSKRADVSCHTSPTGKCVPKS